jgi:hypothetical protein
MQWFVYSHKDGPKDGPKEWELFGGILGWMFFGDVLKKVAEEVERMYVIVFSFIPEKG